jgi:CheY-like chemotaxis protein
MIEDASAGASGDFAGLRTLTEAIVAELGLALARIWIRSADTEFGVGIACAVPADDPGGSGGLKPDAVARALRAAHVEPERSTAAELNARFREPVAARSFLGAPLFRDASAIAYFEAYSEEPVALERFAAARERLTAFLASKEATSIPTGTIVLAEDDDTTRAILCRMLRRHHYRVVDVENGQLACYAVRKEQPDLVLLDWGMPVMSGHETTTFLKTDPTTRAIPILMLTSHSQIEDKIAALESGVQDFITKPFDEQDLIARIVGHMRWRHRLGEATKVEDDVPPSAATDLRAGLTPAETTISPGVVPPGDTVWLLAAQAAHIGNLREAIRLFMLEAERCDSERRFVRAAVAYRSAAIAASEQLNVPLWKRLMVLAGTMFTTAAEKKTESDEKQQSYVSAARCFLACGELHLTRQALDAALAESSDFEMV